MILIFHIGKTWVHIIFDANSKDHSYFLMSWIYSLSIMMMMRMRMKGALIIITGTMKFPGIAFYKDLKTNRTIEVFNPSFKFSIRISICVPPQIGSLTLSWPFAFLKKINSLFDDAIKQGLPMILTMIVWIQLVRLDCNSIEFYWDKLK